MSLFLEWKYKLRDPCVGFLVFHTLNPVYFFSVFYSFRSLSIQLPSELLFQALLSRNFVFKSFLIAGTYPVDSISSSKSKQQIYYFASFLLHSKARIQLADCSLFFFFFFVLCSHGSHALQQNNISVSGIKHVRFSFLMSFINIYFISDVRVSAYFHDGDWNSLCFICWAQSVFERQKCV